MAYKLKYKSKKTLTYKFLKSFFKPAKVFTRWNKYDEDQYNIFYFIFPEGSLKYQRTD